jgi:hypothetical protein
MTQMIKQLKIILKVLSSDIEKETTYTSSSN